MTGGYKISILRISPADNRTYGDDKWPPQALVEPFAGREGGQSGVDCHGGEAYACRDRPAAHWQPPHHPAARSLSRRHYGWPARDSLPSS